MNDLADILRRETDRELPRAVARMSDIARTRFGAAVDGVLFYGSCRRQDDPGGLYDLYVLLADYRSLPTLEAWLARILPPNVYYLEYGNGSARRRAKCTVISLRDFERGTSRLWFHSYLWGRFCQPVSLAYARDDRIEQRILGCLANAARTFLSRTAGLAPAQPTTADLWSTGLRASYAAELRNEAPNRADHLFDSHAHQLDAVTRAAGLAELRAQPDGVRWTVELSATARRITRWSWAVRTIQGKLLSLARIFKAWYTFDGGLDYIVWKLARHSDREIVIPDRVRRQPWLYLWGFFWRLYREGVFR